MITPASAARMRSIDSASCPPQSQRCEPNTSPVRHCEWRRTSGAPSRRSPSTSATAVSTFWPATHMSRSNSIASNMPHFVGIRVDAIRHSAPVCAVVFALFACVNIASTLVRDRGLFGGNARRGVCEVGRPLLEERRQRFLGLRRAQPRGEFSRFHFVGRFDLLDEALFEEVLAGPQCAVWFCCELLRRFHCSREQLL